MLTGAVGANEAESGTERLLADSACQARARQGVAEDVRCHIFTEVRRSLRINSYQVHTGVVAISGGKPVLI